MGFDNVFGVFRINMKEKGKHGCHQGKKEIQFHHDGGFHCYRDRHGLF